LHLVGYLYDFHEQFYLENLKEREYLGDVGTDGRLISLLWFIVWPCQYLGLHRTDGRITDR